MKKEKGQALIILLLIMLVALTVGLAITQRSLTDVASSNKVDQSSRAFSAAEAGIEKALQLGGPTTVTSGELQSQASASVRSSGLLPKSGQALEYPPIGKETVAQFWLADPKTVPPNPPTTSYPANTALTIYFGRGNQGANPYFNTQDPDLPAIEVNLISCVTSGGVCNGTYKSYKTFYDPVNSRTGVNGNNFTPVGSNGTCQNFVGPFNTSNSRSADPNDKDRYFRCGVTITTPVGEEPIMIRARVLYTNTAQPIAVAPAPGQNLPQQAEIYTSIGLYGNTQQKIQVFKMQYVVPAYFDYAIFSAGDISKVGS
jgi:hypothetical protein